MEGQGVDNHDKSLRPYPNQEGYWPPANRTPHYYPPGPGAHPQVPPQGHPQPSYHSPHQYPPPQFDLAQGYAPMPIPQYSPYRFPPQPVAYDMSGLQQLPDIKGRKRGRSAELISLIDDVDHELKQMAFQAASQTPLHELASRIKSLDTEDIKQYGTSTTGSPQGDLRGKETKERQRQVFGMVWLLNLCEASPTAVVPRNRIYARYVSVCADHNLTPLLPALFGKLVRILFPNLTTRRLGMRGQLKYHYCGIKLNGDQNLAVRGHHRLTSLYGLIMLEGLEELLPENKASRTALPRMSTPTNSPRIETLELLDYQVPLVVHLQYVPDLFGAVAHLYLTTDGIDLPAIYPYVPLDTDSDIADTLYLLYKVHINSLFELLRFMQLKRFFACFSNFNLILTAPVIKLYTSDLIVEWIKLCDLSLYKRMVWMLTRLHFQKDIPLDLLMLLKQVAEGFLKAMLTNLINNKANKYLMELKLKLAKVFTNMLKRLIRVIESNKATIRILQDETDKHNIVADWMELNIDEIVRREILCSEINVGVAVNVLKHEVVELLTKEGDASQLMMLMLHFLTTLPAKFSGVNPRLFIVMGQNLLSTCLRELLFNQAKGFGAWWVIRVWVDDFIMWCFELGGFLADDIARSHRQPPPPPPQTEAPPVEGALQLEDFDNDGHNLSYDLMEYGLDAIKSDNDMLLNYETNVENFLG